MRVCCSMKKFLTSEKKIKKTEIKIIFGNFVLSYLPFTAIIVSCTRRKIPVESLLFWENDKSEKSILIRLPHDICLKLILFNIMYALERKTKEEARRITLFFRREQNENKKQRAKNIDTVFLSLSFALLPLRCMNVCCNSSEP